MKTIAVIVLCSWSVAMGFMGFTENRGQWPEAFLFRGTIPGGTLWFTREGVILVNPRDGTVTASTFSQALPEPVVQGMGRLAHPTSFFIGDSPDHWRTGVPSFRYLLYLGVYPGTDVEFTVDDGLLRHRFIVDSREKPEVAQFSHTGDPVSVPRWSETGEAAAPRRENSSGVSLVYGTFLGGSGEDRSYSIAVDQDGCFYVTGRTGSGDFPLQEPFQQAYGGGTWDAFVTKFAPDGTELVYSTFIGGSGDDNGYGIAVDHLGSVHLTGTTGSADFPTHNPLQPSFGGGPSDAFVLKLSPGGDMLVYSTYLGGSGSETGRDISTDGSGRSYVTGSTTSNDFPLQNPFQPGHGGSSDAFAAALSEEGTHLEYSTYLGGASDDFGEGIHTDQQGYSLIAGRTSSPGFPVLNPFQPVFAGGDSDAFLVRISPEGQPVYSTFLGGTGNDGAENVSSDGEGKPYLTGITDSADFPLKDPFQSIFPGGTSAFVTRFTPDGAQLDYSTYIGGTGLDQGRDIAVSPGGHAHVTGYTSSTDFPVQNPFQESHAGGVNDAFILKLSPDGSQLEYSTYLGGSGNDSSRGIALNSQGAAYATGGITSTDFPLQNPFQGFFGGGQTDCFVAVLSPFGTFIEEPSPSPPGTVGIAGIFPNPFTAGVNLLVFMAEPGHLEVSVFDLAGRRVAVPFSGIDNGGGIRTVRWESGGNPPGVYLFRAVSGSSSAWGRAVLL